MTRLGREDGRIKYVRPRGERTVTVLDEERTVSEFTATATVDGVSVEVFLDVVAFKHSAAGHEDCVVAVAAYPRALPGERERVDTLLRAIEHPASAG